MGYRLDGDVFAHATLGASHPLTQYLHERGQTLDLDRHCTTSVRPSNVGNRYTRRLAELKCRQRIEVQSKKKSIEHIKVCSTHRVLFTMLKWVQTVQMMSRMNEICSATLERSQDVCKRSRFPGEGERCVVGG